MIRYFLLATLSLFTLITPLHADPQSKSGESKTNPVPDSKTQETKTLRLDFYHTGKSGVEIFSVDQIVREHLPWPGNPKQAIDDLNLGLYFFEVIDPATKKVLYSRGFCSIFGEWVTTAEAKKVHRTFTESLRFPEPSVPVQIVVKKRDEKNQFVSLWTTEVNPNDVMIDSAKPDSPGELIAFEKNGDPTEKVDLLILGDGYTAQQRSKFEADSKRMLKALFEASPFKERRKDFNVWGLCPPASESGIRRPSSKVYRNSPLGSSYDIFGSERYLLTYDNKAVRRVASFAPYEFTVIITNSPTYGGGGIYGLYCTVAMGSVWAEYVFVHELGHHLGGLADEYYTSAVAYLSPTQKVEPWEPNVTANLEGNPLKWNDLKRKDTPIPTPWQKDEYERISREFQLKRTQLRKENRPESEFDELTRENKRLEQELLRQEKFARQVGLFEGANYEAKGYFRPEANCIMFTRTDYFCTVCQRAIEKVIDRYTAK